MKMRYNKKRNHKRLISWLEPHMGEGKRIIVYEDVFSLYFSNYGWLREHRDDIRNQRDQSSASNQRLRKFLPYRHVTTVPSFYDDLLSTVVGKKVPDRLTCKDYAKWCEEHATGYWAIYEPNIMDSHTEIAFGRAEDLVLFKLTFA